MEAALTKLDQVVDLEEADTSLAAQKPVFTTVVRDSGHIFDFLLKQSFASCGAEQCRSEVIIAAAPLVAESGMPLVKGAAAVPLLWLTLGQHALKNYPGGN